jgi:hypothetical protein
MKRAIFLQHLVLPAWAICATMAVSAQVPNGGFESWTDQGGYTEPTGWLTYNEVPTVGGPTVEAGTPGHPGNFHVSITTRQSTGGVAAIQGWISAGSSTGHPGFPYAQRPGFLTGQWQYGIQPNDTGLVTVAFSKWDGSNTQAIGVGTLAVTGALPDWQSFSVPITWLSTETPDTCYIQIVSSISFTAPTVGSYMGVDDLAFSGSAGVAAPVAATSGFSLRSLAKDQLRVTAPTSGTLRFFTVDGRAVGTWAVPGTEATLRVAELPQGILLYRFTDRNGRQVAAGKWVKE